MRLLRIQARNFLSYAELDLDFTGVSQVAIVGKNGAGKSAILDALLWCLYGEGRGSADEMVQDGSLSSRVTTTWERNGEEVQIIRTRSLETKAGESALSVYIDHHNASKHTIAQTQAFIEHLMGMPARALLAGPVMVQGSSDALLSATPAARKDVLIRLLGLDVWDRYLTEAKERLSSVDQQQDALQRQIDDMEESRRGDPSIEILEAELATMTAEAANIEQLIAKLQEEAAVARENAARLLERQERARALGRLIDEAQVRLDKGLRSQIVLDAAIREQEEVLERAVPEVVTVVPAADEMRRIDAEVLRVQQEIFALNAKRDGVEDLQAERSRVAAIAAKAHPCEGDPPTCRYAQLHQQAQGRVEAIDGQLQAIEEATSTLPELQRSFVSLNDEAASHRGAIEKATRARLAEERARDQAIAARGAAEQLLAARSDQRIQLQAQIDQDNAAIKEYNRERTKLMQDEYAMGDLAGQLRDLKGAIDGATEQQAQVRKSLSDQERLIAVIKQNEATLARLKAQRDELAPERDALKALAQAFHRNGVPTMILEGAIPDIEQRANDILAKLPDDYAIRLDTQVETKAGTAKDTLDIAVLTADRERAYHLLSGGQRFRVDFALRLGLSGFNAARHDTQVDLLWLDEPLGSLDPEGQEAVAETLAAVRDDYALTAVTTHVPDFNDRFDAQLRVAMADQISTAELL